HHVVAASFDCPPTTPVGPILSLVLLPPFQAQHGIGDAPAALASLFGLDVVIIGDIDELVERREALVSQRPADAVLEHGYGERLGFLPVAGLPGRVLGQAPPLRL